MFKSSYIKGVQQALCDHGMLTYADKAEASAHLEHASKYAFDDNMTYKTDEHRIRKVATILVGLQEKSAGIGSSVTSTVKKLAPLASKHKGALISTALTVPAAAAVAKKKPLGVPPTPLGN